MTAPKVTFNKIRTLLTPESEASGALGRHICHNQPDVEVLAMALKRVPCTKEAFDRMKMGEKDWVHLQFCVLAVGPPGFSSAPYSSTKKKGEKDKDTMPLYETSMGSTTFFTFEKGRTGKDRGCRVDEVDGVRVSAALQPGVCLTKFLRDENDAFEPGRLFLADGDVPVEIPENSFVYLQVGVTNSEQALAGRILKIKRIKVVVDPAQNVSPFLRGMPTSAEAHEAVMTESRDRFPSLAMSTIIPSFKIFTLRPETSAYVAQEGGDAVLVCDGQQHHINSRVLEGTLASNPSRARKLLNIAIAMDAVTVLLRARPHEEVVMETPSSQVVHIHIDTNRLLLSKSISEYDVWPGVEGTRLQLSTVDNLVYWTDSAQCITLPSDEEAQLLFELSLTQKSSTDQQNKMPARLLSDGCTGEFYPLRIYTAPCGPMEELIAQKSLVMSLQLRPGLRNNASAGGKRKREVVEADEQDLEND